MTKLSFDDSFNIYLFSAPSTTTEENNLSSKLGEFLSFLKFNKVNLPYKFSFVSSQASLIPEMTLNENILIDFEANSLTESKINQFQDFLKLQNNRALESLYQSLILPNEYPAQSDAQMNKVCSLIKSLLFEGQFIFLEEPEHGLDLDTLKVFTDALKQQMEEKSVNVFIYSRKTPLWLPHAHYLVERTRSFSFQVTKLDKQTTWEKDRKGLYLPRQSEVKIQPRALTFNIPASRLKKKSAA